MTRPSWQDFGTFDESAYPELWDGVVGAWCPSLGPTGLRLHDHSRRNNWGTLTNMDAATDWVVSGGQYALDFDGTNDYVSVAHSQTFASGTQLTASAWVKRNAAGVYAELVNKFTGTGIGNSDQDGWLFRWHADNKLVFTVANSGSYGQYSATNANTSTAWNHVAAVHEFGTTAKTAIYLNGVAVAASWTTGGTQVPDSDATIYPIIIGAQRYAAASYNLLAGQIDDVAVFNRILTPGEVLRLYLLGRGGIYERRRRTLRRVGVEQGAAFRAYWARRQNQIIGGGV
ncbi:MAG: LamG domain-containing protein [Alphaproteobacteria bacterium]